MTQPTQGPIDTDTVHITEVGPRDGFQREKRIVPTQDKIEIITQLADAGIGSIQVTAFVHPDQVPQMADAEAVVAGLPKRKGTIYNGLVLNPRGLDRALATDLEEIEVSASASDAHSRANTGLSWSTAAAAVVDMIRNGRRAGRRIRAGIQCAFGHRAPGDVSLDRVRDLSRSFADASPHYLALADTTGMAHPHLVRRTLAAVTDAMPPERLILHFHDTRGLGLVNVMAALDARVRRFDTAFGGFGGCPAVPTAAGNIATEDLAHLLDRLGHPTGVDIPTVTDAARRMTAFFGHTGTGRITMLD